jgi:hypothetical protein
MTSNPTSFPASWGEDLLSQHAEFAHRNAQRVYNDLEEAYSFLLTLDGIFSALLEKPDELITVDRAYFLMRSHAAFRSACTLALSGQVSECAPISRVALEIALYCLHAAQDAKRFDTWYQRNETEETRKAAKKEFSTQSVMSTLREVSPRIEPVVSDYYDRTIDFGAHPNRASMATSMGMDDNGFWLDYISTDPQSFALGFAIVAKTALATTLVWEAVFPELFNSLGLVPIQQELQSIVHTITPNLIERMEESNKSRKRGPPNSSFLN